MAAAGGLVFVEDLFLSDFFYPAARHVAAPALRSTDGVWLESDVAAGVVEFGGDGWGFINVIRAKSDSGCKIYET